MEGRGRFRKAVTFNNRSLGLQEPKKEKQFTPGASHVSRVGSQTSERHDGQKEHT